MLGLRLLLLAVVAFSLSQQAKMSIPSGEMNIEIYFVIDDKCSDRYLHEVDNDRTEAKTNLMKDINFYLAEVNKMFASFYETKIQISIRDIEFITEKVYRRRHVKKDGTIQHLTALHDFDRWLRQKGARAKYDYDMAILFTGYSLINKENRNHKGVSRVGSVCSEGATGIVESDGTYSTALFTAHEIAHILGARHDDRASTYVMAPSMDPDSHNRWFFSLCSAGYTWDVLNSLKDNCLLRTNSTSVTPDGDVTTGLSDPDTVCMRKHGSSYYFNHYKGVYDNHGPSGDVVCRRVYCAKPYSNVVNHVLSTTGMVCGVGKTCREGKCESNPESTAAAAVKDDSCVFGDQKIVGHHYTSCEKLIDKVGLIKACRVRFFQDLCCDTFAKRGCQQFLDHPKCKGYYSVKCKNHNICIPASWLCDDYDDCGDNWDEMFCDAK